MLPEADFQVFVSNCKMYVEEYLDMSKMMTGDQEVRAEQMFLSLLKQN